MAEDAGNNFGHGTVDPAALLAPRSVAFVGVSARGGAGAKMLRSTLKSGFDGPIWPVNPRADEIEGIPCVPSLADLPQPPDCVVIAVPAEAVLDILRDAAAVGARAALVVSEGFGDAGTEDGRTRQEALVKLARENGIALAGPNCMGIATTAHHFAATMGDIPEGLVPGGISLVSQSGGLMNAVMELSANRGIGLNYTVSMGNQAAMDLADYIDFLADDTATSVIACIMEGAKDGRRFRAAIERAAPKKPIVILKLGRSAAGQVATLAHTGTLAGSHELYEALFRMNGVALVRSIDELVETAALFGSASLPKGNGVCLLTVSGGATSLIGDLGEQAGIQFPDLSDETRRRVGEALGIERAFNNPLDTVGMPRLRKEGAIDGVVMALDADPNVHVIGLVLGMRSDGAPAHNMLVERMEKLAAASETPMLVVSFISNSLTGRWRDYAATRRLPILEDLECGLRAIGHLVAYAEARRALVRGIEAAVPDRVETGVEGTLSEAAGKRLLGRAGLPVTREFLAETPTQAAARAAEIGGRVAIKVQSADIPHKSDVGGVHLGAGPEDAEEASEAVLRNARAACPGARVEGVLVQEMVDDGAEFILGMSYDDQFGPMVVLGAGGVMTELFRDSAVGLPPISHEDAHAMIDRVSMSRLLAGFRGSPVLDREALANCIVKFSEFVAATDGQFAAIDLNPVFVRPEGRGVAIADALVISRTR